MGDVVKSAFDVFGFDALSKTFKVPLEMLDVSVQGDGGVGNDGVVIQIGCAPGWNDDFGDTSFGESLFAFPFGGSGQAVADDSDVHRCVDQIFVAGEMKNSFAMLGDFHPAEGHSFGPFLGVEGSQARRGDVAVQDSMFFADIELVAVVTVHEVGVVDFQGEQIGGFRECDDVVFWSR